MKLEKNKLIKINLTKGFRWLLLTLETMMFHNKLLKQTNL